MAKREKDKVLRQLVLNVSQLATAYNHPESESQSRNYLDQVSLY